VAVLTLTIVFTSTRARAWSKPICHDRRRLYTRPREVGLVRHRSTHLHVTPGIASHAATLRALGTWKHAGLSQVPGLPRRARGFACPGAQGDGQACVAFRVPAIAPLVVAALRRSVLAASATDGHALPAPHARKLPVLYIIIHFDLK
jgi:hypothetical protein